MANERLDNPFYYLDNFLRVLDWLELRYADLLDPEERSFIAGFRQAPQAAQALLVRMVMRKGTLFRAGRLSYPEIGAIEDAAAVLLANGWLDDQAPIELTQLFEVLLKPEVLRCFEGQISQVSARKADLLAQLLEHYPQPQVFAAWCPQLNDTLYALRVQALCDRLRLLFFGNLHQDWTEFVLADLGIYRYEQVALSDESRALRSRDDVHACVELHACRAVLEEGGDLQGVLARVNGLVTDNPWLLGRRDKLLLQMGQACERAADWPLALQLYASSAHPRARQRRVRVLELSDRPAEALALANLALAAPQSAAEAQLIARALPRLRRKLGLPNPLAAKPPPWPAWTCCSSLTSAVAASSTACASICTKSRGRCTTWKTACSIRCSGCSAGQRSLRHCLGRFFIRSRAARLTCIRLISVSAGRRCSTLASRSSTTAVTGPRFWNTMQASGACSPPSSTGAP